MNQPLISIIIPTYNDETTLAAAVDSMIDQTYLNTEIIIIDDNSTDKTEAVARELAKKDPRVRVLKCPYIDPNRVDWRGVNISVGYLARNYAMDNSRGEWITFQDADDASLKNRIEVQYALAVKHKASLITTGWQAYRHDLAEKSLDVECIFRDEKVTMLSPKETTAFAQGALGLLERRWFPYKLVPFMVKKHFPFFRKLFFGHQKSYPGADNSMFFHRDIIKNVRFRKLKDRQWAALSGRGVGRDFVCQAAYIYKNSYSFNLPIYLWRVNWTEKQYDGWDAYLL